MFGGGLFETPFRWIGRNFLGITYEYDVSGYGSGDNTYAYVTLFMNFLLTVPIVLTWHFLDKRRSSYNKLFYWFLVILRIFLVLAMFLYGFVKVFQLQFSPPTLVRLLEPLGNFSPMGLAWTYMGYSQGFNFFVGMMEILGGILLIPRRTSTLGAFIVVGVMTHVAIMNFMFDIPVKLFSVHLALMALVIFLTDFRRFLNVFIKNRPTEIYEYYNPIKDKQYHKIIYWVKLVATTVVIGIGCVFGFTQTYDRGLKRDLPQLYGIWEVKRFIKNNDTLQPLITDDERWRYLILDFVNRATVKTMTDEKLAFNFEVDTASNTIKMYKDDEPDHPNFQFRRNEDFMGLMGNLENDSIKIELIRKDLNDFLLKSRGFNWINERPLNR